LFDSRVDYGRRVQALALARPAVDIEAHGLQQAALRHRRDGTIDLGGWPQQVVDQRVDRAFHLAPRAGRETQLDPLAGLALAPDHLPDAIELFCHTFVGSDDFVESVGDLAHQADLIAGPANGEIADPHGLQRAQQLMKFRRAAVDLLVAESLGRRRYRCAVLFKLAAGRTAGWHDGCSRLSFRLGRLI